MSTDLTVRRGDTRAILITDAVTRAGEPFDLTDGVVFFTAVAGDVTIVKTSEDGGGITVTGLGSAAIDLDPADTAELGDDVLLTWDVEVITGIGDVFTLDAGILLVEKDVTR